MNAKVSNRKIKLPVSMLLAIPALLLLSACYTSQNTESSEVAQDGQSLGIPELFTPDLEGGECVTINLDCMSTGYIVEARSSYSYPEVCRSVSQWLAKGIPFLVEYSSDGALFSDTGMAELEYGETYSEKNFIRECEKSYSRKLGVTVRGSIENSDSVYQIEVLPQGTEQSLFRLLVVR